ncbi:hypothetical protein CDAR_122461 [Caerostris darwini]|uniref:Uncharacterized protein n=1 Tax=Caerostris darwini TaxID=1538125 RepID=A0AAV4M9R6_9ARAC|nr:hypothetical protein CDAR_122461 [Caerostris darwini]
MPNDNQNCPLPRVGGTVIVFAAGGFVSRGGKSVEETVLNKIQGGYFECQATFGHSIKHPSTKQKTTQGREDGLFRFCFLFLPLIYRELGAGGRI